MLALRYIFIYFYRIKLIFKSLGQEMKSKKEENEIFTLDSHAASGWLV
jgi:hypothetical protein